MGKIKITTTIGERVSIGCVKSSYDKANTIYWLFFALVDMMHYEKMTLDDGIEQAIELGKLFQKEQVEGQAHEIEIRISDSSELVKVEIFDVLEEKNLSDILIPSKTAIACVISSSIAKGHIKYMMSILWERDIQEQKIELRTK